MSADKEELHREGELLPGWVPVAVTEVRDLLRGLWCSHLLDFGCLGVLSYPRKGRKPRIADCLEWKIGKY